MKNILTLLLAVTLLFTLAACGENGSEETDATTTADTVETTTVSADTDDTAAETEDTTTVADGTTTTVAGSTSAQKTTTTAGKVTDKEPTKTASNTTTTAYKQPVYPEYYEVSRKKNATATSLETMFRKVYEGAQDWAGFGGGEPETEDEYTYALYSVDGAGALLQYMDIFGYNLTLDDLLGSNFGGVDIQSNLVGPSLRVDYKGAKGFAFLPLKDTSKFETFMREDVAKVKAMFADKGLTPSISINYGSYKNSIDAITDEMYKTASNGQGNELKITYSGLKADGKTFDLTYAFTAKNNWDEPPKPSYYFSVSISNVR